MRVTGVVLGSPDPRSLASFYRQLLGWEIERDEPDWVKLIAPDGPTGLSFQLEPDHVAPTWPATPGAQQMQVHLDIWVESLDAGVQYALQLGAQLAPHQFEDGVQVLIDPDGHPFCLWER
jgi:catechol 2,3-dioxygenase-like lactoylglutathione lyase family enzyme